MSIPQATLDEIVRRVVDQVGAREASAPRVRTAEESGGIKMRRGVVKWGGGSIGVAIFSLATFAMNYANDTLTQTAQDMAAFEEAASQEHEDLRRAIIDQAIATSQSHDHLQKVIKAVHDGRKAPPNPPLLDDLRTKTDRVERQREIFDDKTMR